MDLFTLDVTPLAAVLASVVPSRRSGILTVVQPDGRTGLYWSQGELVLAAPEQPEHSFAAFMVRRGIVGELEASVLSPVDPTDLVPLILDRTTLEITQRQQHLREWLAAVTIPLFNLTEGTVAFEEAEPIEPEKRIFLQSMPALVASGVRTMTNGLAIRRALGDLKRDVVLSADPPFPLAAIPLTDAERATADSLREPRPLESFLKGGGGDSLTAARVAIMLDVLGVLETAVRKPAVVQADTTEQDVALLAAIGGSDPRSLRAAGFSRQLSKMSLYEILHVPRSGTRAQIIARVDEMRTAYDPATYPPAMQDCLRQINQRIDLAASTLRDPTQRQEYDRLLSRVETDDGSYSIEQRMTRRQMAEKNFLKAQELAFEEEYYSAIVLLRQAVGFAPDHAAAWYLLGSCQQRNPKWIRHAIESYHRALAVDPNHVDALLSLGDLYRAQGLTARAQSCFEDVLQIASDHPEAKSRLKAMKK